MTAHVKHFRNPQDSPAEISTFDVFFEGRRCSHDFATFHSFLYSTKNITDILPTSVYLFFIFLPLQLALEKNGGSNYKICGYKNGDRKQKRMPTKTVSAKTIL